MALPILFQKLFNNNGAGPYLKSEIIADRITSASYDATTGLLSLTDATNQTVATVTVPSVGTVLKSAELQDNGNLELTWQLADESETTTTIDLSALIDEYTSGTGISIQNNVVSIDQDWLSENTISVTSGNGISISTTENESSIAVDSSVVRLEGAQTITGNKTFNADIFMTPTNLERNIQFTGAYTKGSAAPSSDTGSVWSVETFGASVSASPGNNRVSRIGMEQGNTDVSCFMQLNQPVASSTTTASITIRWPYGDDTEPYATAPATRSSPISTEIVTVGYLRSVLGTTTYDMPLYFDTDNGEYEWGEVHTFVPTGVTTVQLVAIEADGSGTTDLGITMELDIGTGSSLTITSTATSCSDFAGRAVVFSVSGTSDQTEIAALLRFS